MDSNYKIYKDGTGSLFAIDNIGIKTKVDAADLSSAIRASSLKPGEYINVASNKYSAIKSNVLSSNDFSACTYNFNLKK